MIIDRTKAAPNRINLSNVSWKKVLTLKTVRPVHYSITSLLKFVIKHIINNNKKKNCLYILYD